MDQVLSMEEFLVIFKKCLPKEWKRTKPYCEIYPNSLEKSRLREVSFHLWEGECYDHGDVIVKALEPPEQEVCYSISRVLYTCSV